MRRTLKNGLYFVRASAVNNYSCAQSFQYQGLKSERIDVQVIQTRGQGVLALSGQLAPVLKESRDKIIAIIAQIRPWKAMDRLIVHLLPSEITKNSSYLELPIVIASLLALSGDLLSDERKEMISEISFAAELSLNGDLLSSSFLDALEKFSNQSFIGAKDFKRVDELWNYLLYEDLELLQVRCFKQSSLNGRALVENEFEAQGRLLEKVFLAAASLTKRPVLLLGPPGLGKSHLARWAHSVSLKDEKKISEHQLISYLAGVTSITEVSLIAPHARARLSEFVGFQGARGASPGYFSLAHGSTLILDEFAELSRDCREVLRNLLDEKKIRRNIKGNAVEWPADFWLIMTANPCPCAFAMGEDLSLCRCPENERLRYVNKFSGPILDRSILKLFLQAEDFVPKLHSIVQDAFREEPLFFIQDAQQKYELKKHDLELKEFFIEKFPIEFDSFSQRKKAHFLELCIALSVFVHEERGTLFLQLIQEYLQQEKKYFQF